MTDIVERLRELGPLLGRPSELQQAADEIERLRAELAQWTDVFGHLGTADECGNEWIALKDELAASQAREAKLRAALNNVAWLRHPSVRSSTLVEKLERIALDALALPHDDSALKERLKQERERVADYVYTHSSYIDDDGEQVTFAGHAMLAAAIRAMGDE